MEEGSVRDLILTEYMKMNMVFPVVLAQRWCGTSFVGHDPMKCEITEMIVGVCGVSRKRTTAIWRGGFAGDRNLREHKQIFTLAHDEGGAGHR